MGFEMDIGVAPRPSKKYRTKEQCESDNENVPTSEDDDTRRREEKLIKIAPVHYTGGVKDCSERFSELGKRLEDIKAEVSSIWEKQDVRMVNIEKYLLEISKNTRTVAATNVAKILGPSISSSISDNISTPDTSFDNALNEIENEDLLKSTVDDHTESPEPIPQLGDKRPQMGEQKEAKNKNSFPYSKDLIPAGQLPYIYTKSKTRRNFAALLVKRLFDVETLLKSNVSGRGKEQLDPEIIKYVKAKAFEYYECPQPEVKKEWAKCVIAIDEKSRSLKKRKSYKENQSLDVINDKLQGLSKLKVLEEKNSTDDIEERIRALQELKKQKEKQ